MSVAFRLDKSYLALIKQFPLVPIVNVQQLELATAVVRNLTTPSRLAKLTKSERDYLAVLNALIREYNSKHYKGAPSLSGAQLLNLIMEEHALKQNDIAELAGTYQSVVSAILSGRRRISRSSAIALARHFNINVDALLR